MGTLTTQSWIFILFNTQFSRLERFLLWVIPFISHSSFIQVLILVYLICNLLFLLDRNMYVCVWCVCVCIHTHIFPCICEVLGSIPSTIKRNIYILEKFMTVFYVCAVNVNNWHYAIIFILFLNKADRNTWMDTKRLKHCDFYIDSCCIKCNLFIIISNITQYACILLILCP
jgi:hypothetical protein